MKRILVTGAAGFIGFHLSLALKKRNDFVIGLDNFNSYYDVNLKDARAQILKKNDIEIIKADIREKEKIKNIIETNKITHVVHLAAQAGVRHSFTHPEDYIGSNIEGFVSVLEVIKDHPHINFIFASSSSVYGSNNKIPFSTEDRTDNQTNLYGATKKANESIAYAYHHLYKIPMIGLRYFTVYGPWGRPDMAYFSFTKDIYDGKPISIFNNGNMKRDFTYIDDIIDGTIAAIDSNIPFDIFNLGNNQPVDLLNFISILEEKIGKNANKQFLPMQQGEMLVTYADINRSQEILKFSPKISIEQGLNMFFQWYKSYYLQ